MKSKKQTKNNRRTDTPQRDEPGYGGRSQQAQEFIHEYPQTDTTAGAKGIGGQLKNEPSPQGDFTSQHKERPS